MTENLMMLLLSERSFDRFGVDMKRFRFFPFRSFLNKCGALLLGLPIAIC